MPERNVSDRKMSEKKIPEKRVIDAEVIRNEKIAEGIMKLTAAAPQEAAEARPGQFCNLVSGLRQADPSEAGEHLRRGWGSRDADLRVRRRRRRNGGVCGNRAGRSAASVVSAAETASGCLRNRGKTAVLDRRRRGNGTDGVSGKGTEKASDTLHRRDGIPPGTA